MSSLHWKACKYLCDPVSWIYVDSKLGVEFKLIASIRNWDKCKVFSSPDYPECRDGMVPVREWDYRDREGKLYVTVAGVNGTRAVHTSQASGGGCQSLWLMKIVCFLLFKWLPIHLRVFYRICDVALISENEGI